MGRPLRQIISKQVYEACFRTKQGLPFVCTLYMKLIIKGILARVQRDLKVTICHMLWMGNHAHVIVVTRDAKQCHQFYGEVQKQLTEAVKKLLGVPRLSLWNENDTALIHLGDVEGVIQRIAYLYANPARAHLVDTISSYPGFSTWEVFRSLEPTLSAKSVESCPWIQQGMISKLPCSSVSAVQDKRLVERLKERAREEHDLVFQPNAWMAVFRLRNADVAEVNKRILKRLEEYEVEARTERCAKGWRVKGASKLASEALGLSYLPSKFTRKISVYAKDPELRCQMIERRKEFTKRYRECYERWRVGDFFVEWPPGAILPPAPQQMNWLPV